MFEATKVGRTVDKETFKSEQEALRTELLIAQRSLRKAKLPVVVIITGVEGAGKGEVVNRLYEWFDTRGVGTYAFWDETDEERQRPRYWRFWRSLPARGNLAILFGGWYLSPIERRFKEEWSDAELDAELSRIADFERMLIVDGALIVKFWFHLPEKVQKKRLKELARDDRSRWKMVPDKARFTEHYTRFERIGERVVRLTDRGISPWYLVEATDRRYRDLTVGKALLTAIQTRLAAPVVADPPPVSAIPGIASVDSAQRTLLDRLDLTQKLPRTEYKTELERYQERLGDLTWRAYQSKRSVVLVFEGMDAAGKGGTIRRITNAIDARLYRAIPVAAPSDEARSYHYLWRFWRNIPRAGYITLYDRSWYGRVLVERVEGFATDAEWARAYAEINQFEEQLVESGVLVFKFWMQISLDEQLRRFRERENIPYKRYKITDEDWRNRDKWPAYKIAVNEMIAHTSTELAPWTLVEGDDKPFARIKVLRTLCDGLEKALE